MQLIFGKGDILVTEAGNSEQRHILMEMGRGSGEVGAKNLQYPDRQEGGEVQPEDLENATCTLTFDNPVSLGVVLEKALVGMVAFRRAGRTLGEANADLGLSLRELCHELLGMKDEVAEEI